jgi:hypothetical protein
LAELPPNSRLSPDFELISSHPVQQLLRYPMSSHTDFVLDSNRIPDPTRYLQMPSDSAPRARQLARQFRNAAIDNAETVKLALQYIREQPFYYTRQPPFMIDDPVDEFLFDNRRGFCEHYASSFVFLMRAAGIPARVVTGYQGGEMNPQSDYFIVRQSDAHAWAEVWLHEKGWLRIDPTAVIPAERIENLQDLARIRPKFARLGEAPSWLKSSWRQLRFGWDRLNHAWNQWVINYNDQRQKNFLSKLLGQDGFTDIDWREMVSLLGASMGAILLIIGLYVLRPWHKSQTDPITTAYDRFCRKLARRGIHREPAEGPLDFAQRAKQRRPELGPAINHITSLYQRLRYAPQPKSNQLSEQQLHRLQSAVRQFKA